MVATCKVHPSGLLTFQKSDRNLNILLSLFLNRLRTVLAVKGSLRRAYRRALDRSGPF
jgi:hypothetical protein